ncbi:hypothetical protein [Pseudonocardia charpentierae]|uniref:Uncharacterized protein n=1 Tax=Pseudonocardia charpentierae TaxID=3075545 RepID=A0ABU2NGL5_9PSEU|nr:hypothetical protein [Pseudonocardia sp. DSM 45834]MDT0353102.1 hypothetical protein [Pseudonocardia sp. DSM 45834]
MDEATVIGEAAARAGMSVGAWVGDTAVGRARMEAVGDELDEVGGAGLWSGRELVAALVALRAEVAALRRVPVVEVDAAAPAAKELPGQSFFGIPGLSDRAAVVEVLRRIDAVTAAVVEAMSSGARRSSPAGRSGQS